MYQIDLTNLVEAILGILALIAMRYLIPWIKAKLDNEQEAKLVTIFEIAVMAAEKLYGAKHGDEKFAYVEQYLAVRGIKLDTMRIMAYVNAAIKQMEQQENGGVTIVENINGIEADEEDEENAQEG